MFHSTNLKESRDFGQLSVTFVLSDVTFGQSNVTFSRNGFFENAFDVLFNQPERVEKIVVEDMTVSDLHSQVAELFKMQFPLLRKAFDSIPPELDEIEASKFIPDFMFKNIPQPPPDSGPKPEYKGIMFH
ncbi:hypothetical protein CEXT_533851 [Caerostris extrusa]|uniref:Uncharacterized protein n=1 Tax=Caerostris extrusa TaxID=172846 RepID=A0AAV4P6U8_CAEEX|nr:hypothetical protein CEXT_533851 [Caerostris extrusa]